MIINVARKELKSMFASPMGWVILALLMFAFGTYYLNGINDYFAVMSGAMRPAERTGVTQFVGQIVYGFASFMVLFAVPLLSMRLISEERRSQTLPFLFSAPISLTEIVLGKFLGLVAFLSILVVYIGLMLSTLNIWADIDFGFIIANSIGLLLMVASFSALGLYFSSMTQQPVIAAILTFIALFALMFLDRFFAGDPSNTLASLSLTRHFQSFLGGLIDTADIAYFVLFIATFLTLTVRRLDADRLRG
ncbi:ABC transporter permease [Methylotenera sp.]|jgi:ABC-2 type transport system permease protein|uniref:ABC transporter permease n=1 Tax=Methylotenera sp. TaxID=2051956 RepID=UPI00271D4669|nr:ABC transporter permease subunit [Methylotenera sp.]MDO9206145.1 ABC transporter permease subunit [Methylotenera sp.]MDP1522985.1 ABC transporter permease subunit [Methylotenera sp.]MDP2070915.1 ABC transporter permease subunit [Methylotenera sp.]MDP3005789.1 ABC transporter permease subunit [Methylotenera sp.]MDP3817391.1 ABC transporter permease subunit [Methylotenera sp.]